MESTRQRMRRPLMASLGSPMRVADQVRSLAALALLISPASWRAPAMGVHGVRRGHHACRSCRHSLGFAGKRHLGPCLLQVPGVCWHWRAVWLHALSLCAAGIFERRKNVAGSVCSS